MKTFTFKLAVLVATISLGSALQARDYDEWFGGNFMLQDLIDAEKGYCLDLEGYASITDTSAPVIVHSCKEGFWKDGTWRVNYPQEGQIYLPEYELCVAAAALEEDADVVLKDCSDAPMQRFDFRENGKVAVISDSTETFCLAVGDTSRATGRNLRRPTRFVNCDNAVEQYTQWILPAENTVYTSFDFTPISLLPTDEQAPTGRPRAGGGQGRGGGAAAGGVRRGPGGNNLYVGACAPCHGRSGEGLASEFAPKLSGQEDWYLTRQLTNFVKEVRGGREGERWATQMSFHIGDFGQAQLDSFVEYIGTLEDTPAEVTIAGDSTRGQQLYAACVACHGGDAMGNAALNSPRLAGMSDWYMVTQLQKFRDGTRGDHPEDTLGAQMVAFSQTLPDEQAFIDVMAYINTLSAP
jgi:cytochrome c553